MATREDSRFKQPTDAAARRERRRESELRQWLATRVSEFAAKTDAGSAAVAALRSSLLRLAGEMALRMEDELA